MQCPIPPVADATQVAERAPHVSLQKVLPPSPGVHCSMRQAMGVAPASTSTGVPPPSERSHCETVPLGNSHTLPSVQVAVPQQKTGTLSAAHIFMRQASPGEQSHADEHGSPTPMRSAGDPLSTDTPKSETSCGGASPSVHPTIKSTNAAANRIIPS